MTFTYIRTLPFEPGAVEVGATAVEEETNMDKDGNVMYLRHTYPTGYQRSPHDTPLEEASAPDVQGHIASVMRAEVVWGVNAVETISKANLKIKAKSYVGKVNNAVWDGCAARTVMCTRIFGRSYDGGTTFDVRYEYQFRDGTWDHAAVYIRDNGKPVPTAQIDSTDRVGWAYKVQKEANFATLPAG